MRTFQHSFTITTESRSSIEITSRLQKLVQATPIKTGICQIFVRHTSASLMITENADPSVRRDLETLLARFAPDGDPDYAHDMEGDDDMAAHARSVLTGSALSVPIGEARLLLGTWQGVYLYEHRASSHQREIVVTLMGSSGPNESR